MKSDLKAPMAARVRPSLLACKGAMRARSASARSPLITFAFLAALACGLVASPDALAQSRGELLYTTHCISCHSTQMHWRDERKATDWPSLKSEVRRWQGAASLGWSDSDILDVSRYLNATIYHFEHSADRVSSSYPDSMNPSFSDLRLHTSFRRWSP